MNDQDRRAAMLERLNRRCPTGEECISNCNAMCFRQAMAAEGYEVKDGAVQRKSA